MYLDRKALDRAGIRDPALRDAYVFCRTLLDEWEDSASALFWHTDALLDIGDPVLRPERYEAWCACVRQALATGWSDHPVCVALLDTVRSWGMAPADVEAHLDGMRSDLTNTEYATYADVERCRRNALGPLVRLWLPVMEPVSADALERAMDLAMAMQLMDFVYDLPEDVGLGRTYLQVADLQASGLVPADLGRGESSPALRGLLRRQIELVRRMWAYGQGIVDAVKPGCRRWLQRGITEFETTLAEIERRDYDISIGPARYGLRTWGRMCIDVPAMVRDELLRRLRDPADGLDAICTYALEPTGKLLRPTLVVESALAVEGSAWTVLPAAVAAECGHVASLIHDDIVDDDELRRGRPSVPHRNGIAGALIAGDMLFFSMFDSLVDRRRRGIPDSRVLDAETVLVTACRDLYRGEHFELDLVGTARLNVTDYLAVARDKTGAGFRAACAVGGILAGGSPELVDALAEYGANLGIAFQIHDDLLPYTGDESTLGKAVTSDVNNRQLTLPVILAYQNTSPAGWARLDRALSGALPPQQAYADLKSLLTETGALDRARDIADEFALLADKNALLLPMSASRDRLRSYAEFAVNRES